MVKLFISKYDFGKSLFPNKFFKLDIKKKFEKNYSILYYDNFYYGIISNFFGLSVILAFATYLYVFEFIYKSFSEYFTSYFWSITINLLFLFILILMYFYVFVLIIFFKYDFKIRKRERNIEKGLPYFLDNLVSNLKGGIPIEKALIDSVPKDNKDLLAEVVIMNQKIMMGESFLSVVKSFIKKYDSPLIKRTFFLISEGFKGGGNLAKSIETISKNMKNINNLFSEFVANSKGFTIVIMAIAIILSPVLFSIALVLLVFLSNLFTLFSKTAGASMLFSLKPVPDTFIVYLKNFSYAVIIVISFFSSMIISELKNEKIYNSIKYIPFFIAISIFIYKVVSVVLLNFFGNII